MTNEEIEKRLDEGYGPKSGIYEACDQLEAMVKDLEYLLEDNKGLRKAIKSITLGFE